ncbi:MAG: sugar-binding transcriptional regulator [Christensenellales bacterium]|jgi:deoxyribonucleoside regulator
MDSEVYSPSVWIAMKAAELYYLEGKSQKEVADILELSNSTTSRLLRRAREEQIVEFVIRNPYLDCLSLSRQLEEKYGLQEVIVVPLSAEEASASDSVNVKRMVAHEGARYIQRIVKPNDILGVAFGRTIYHVINYLNPCQKTDTSFVTLHGSLSCCSYELDVRTLVSRMAMAFGGSQYSLLSEGLLQSSESVANMMREDGIRRIFEMFNRTTISLSGLGSFYPIVSSPLAKIEYLKPSEYEYLKFKGVVGDLMLHFFDKDGNECDTDLKERTLTIDLDTYRKIPCKIVVTAGAHKVHTLRAALRGKFMDVLITDYQLASALLELAA